MIERVFISNYLSGSAFSFDKQISWYVNSARKKFVLKENFNTKNHAVFFVTQAIPIDTPGSWQWKRSTICRYGKRVGPRVNLAKSWLESQNPGPRKKRGGTP
jgi:hypothetical protein